MKKQIQALAAQHSERIIGHRRHLHMHPEVSFHEKETRAYIERTLDGLGISYMEIAGCYSVVARIKGDRPGQCVAFRADMDALALTEENDLPYRSQNEGVMHACGHDGHTAALLGLAEIFAANKHLVAGEVVLIFQHAEELPPGGARLLVEQGVLEGVDVILGLHVWGELPLGTVGYNKGAMMACADRFQIQVEGVGGHASKPDTANDALLAAAMLAVQLQTIVSRRLNPLDAGVVSVCQLHSGSAFNIIPQSAVLDGTARTCSERARETIREHVLRIAKGVEAAYGVQCSIQYHYGYPVLQNDASLVERTIRHIGENTSLKLREVPPTMGAEDFAYYTREVPGAFFFVGASPEEEVEILHHNPSFNFDERALAHCIEVFLSAYLGYIGE